MSLSQDLRRRSDTFRSKVIEPLDREEVPQNVLEPNMIYPSRDAAKEAGIHSADRNPSKAKIYHNIREGVKDLFR